MIESEVQGVEETEVKIRAAAGHLGRQLRHIVNDAASIIQQVMLDKVPRDEGLLAESIRKDEGIAFDPGGLGGGGDYTVAVHAGEGIDYLEYVVEGTGIFAGHDPIQATSGNVMPMTYDGIASGFAAFTTGQEPQSEWITDAQEAGRRYIELKIGQLDLGNR